MDRVTTSTFSPRRLAVGLAVQAVITAIDIVVGVPSLTITGSVLLVPLVLAVVGHEREVAITSVVAVAIGLTSSIWTDVGTSQEVYRAAFFSALALVAVLAARTLGRIAKLAARNELLAGELGATQARLDGILGALAEAVTVHDADGRTIYANAAAERLLGTSVDEMLAAAPGALVERFTLTDEAGGPIPIERLPGRRLLAGEEAPELLTRTVRKSDGAAFWLLTKATRYRDASGAELAINIIEDVTEAKQAELRQRFLAEAGQLLAAASLDYEVTLERVARMVVPSLADWCAIDLVDEHGDLELVAVAHTDPAKVELAHEMRRRYPPDPDAPTGAPAIARGGPAEVYPEIPDEMLVEVAVDEEHLRVIREVGLRSAMALPMRIGDVTLGVLSLITAESGRRFDEDDLAFAQDLALRAATAVQNARLYAEQRRVAHTLQASLLPERLPSVPGWDVHAAYQAGERGADVGGDFYDLMPVENGYVVVLGDVTGKGVEAAALTSLVRHSARMAARFDPRPAHVLALVNEVLREQPSLSLVTAVCALVEHGNGAARLTVASAGHPLPLHRRATGVTRPVGEHGVLLGVDGSEDWREVVVPVAAGDAVLFYTDGITDTAGPGGRFGEARLAEAMQRAGSGSAALVEAIESALGEFQTGATADDRAMLAMRFEGIAVSAAA